MKNPFSWLWRKLFGKGPLFEEKEIEYAGQKIKMQMFNKNQIWDALEQAPSGSMMFTSARTYVIVGHVEQEQLDQFRAMTQRMGDEDSDRPECDGNCETCDAFKGYGEDEDGC